MSKKDFIKRSGQLYAQGIQYGYTEKQINSFLEKTFEVFLQPKKEEFYRKDKVD